MDMTGNIILGVALGSPLLIGLLFRINTSFLFLSLLAGELLARYFGDDADLALRATFNNDRMAEYAELIVLVLPIVLTVVFLRNSLSKGKMVLHFIPLAVMGLVVAGFALPLLPETIKGQVEATRAGGELLRASDVIVGGVVLLQLITLWLTGRPEKGSSRKH